MAHYLKKTDQKRGTNYLPFTDENQKVAHRGGRVAGIARQALEAETGKPVITAKNAVDFARLIDEVVKEVEHPKEDNENKNEEI